MNIYTFKEITSQFIEYKKNYVTQSTLAAYISILDIHLIPFFGELTVITTEDVDRYIKEKKICGLSIKTVEGHIICLKSLLKWANRYRIFKTVPIKISYYKHGFEEKREIQPLSTEDSKIFVKYCEDNFSFDNFILMMAILSGLRVGELCALQWKDIDVNRGTISVKKQLQRVMNINSAGTTIIISTPKTPSSIREVPLAPQLMKRVKLLLKICSPDHYIATNTEKPTEPIHLRAILKKVLNKLGLPQIRIHDLRHTFATRCLSAKIDIKTVSVLLGHSTIDTTLGIYLHSDDETKMEAFKKLEKKMSW